MSEDIEYGWMAILLGAFVSLQILAFMIKSIYEIFPDLGIILIIINILILIFILNVVWKETRKSYIWIMKGYK